MNSTPAYGRLQTLVPESELANASADLAPVIDTVQLGYGKVLGKGRLAQDKPLIVKARFVSRRAERKIKEAGGVVKIIA
jgi:large subunit ribosomal protein L27Ae